MQLAKGRSHPEIGAALGISPRTVEVHRANAIHRLGLADTGALVRHAIHTGLVGLD